jgi:PAS domain S-box-containing protein
MLSLGGLRSRLVLLVLIALLPVFGLFAYSAAKDQQDDVALAQGALQSTALLAAVHQQRLVDRVAQLLGDVASAPSIKDPSTRSCEQYLENLQSQAPGYTNLGIAGLDGKVSCNARDSGVDVYAGDRPFFKQVLAGQKFAVGQYGTGRSSGRPGIGFGVPVHGSGGTLNGVAFAAVDISAVAAVLAEVRLMDGAQLRVTDRHGTILAVHPPGAGLQGTQEQDLAMLDAAKSRRAGVREAIDSSGNERVYAYAPVGGAAGDALFVAISVPRDVITAGPREHLRNSLAALLGMAVFGVCCAWWTGARLIVKPARAILKEANEVVEGNLAARIASEFTRHGELGQIARSFNRMAGSLQLRREERDAALQHADKERALRELIFNSMSEGVVATDPAGRLLLLNRAARELHPTREGEVTLEEWSRDHDLLQLDGKTSYLLSERPVARALGGAVIDNWDLVLRRPGTEDRVLRVSTRPLRDADQLVGGVVVFSDITASKLADLALARTNRALQMLSRFSMAINQIHDEAGMLAEVCRVAVEVGSYRMAWVGYAQHDALLTIAPMAHAGDERGYLAEVSRSWADNHVTGLGPAGQAIRSGLPQQSGDIGQADNQFHGREAALERGYRSAIFLPLRDGERSFGVLGLYAGQVQHFASEEITLLQELADNLAFGIGSLRARLARHRSEEAARQAAAQLREQASLLDRAQDAIMVRNLDLTLRFWNQGAQRLYGWSAEEVLGKTMAQYMYRDPQVLDMAMEQTLARGGDWSGELEQLARDGLPIYVEARWTVVRDEKGQINGVLGINTDIRERKRAREEILQLNASLEERVQQRTAQLEYANKELQAFSYSVSHDLRSPLSAVDGFSDLLERALINTPEDPLSKSSRHYLSRIRAGVSQMGELIDALLTLAQVARSRLRWEPVNLSELGNALLHDYQEREPGRVTQLQVEPGLQAHGDARLLKQVLDNLLGNAWKFSAGQSRSDITFGQQRGSKGETVYFVRDNGAGFDMKYAEKLFGPFQRLHGVSEFAGTGIGLATVQRIVVRHGGTVRGESAVGHGATFYFTLGTSPPES